MQREERTKDKILALLTGPKTYTELKETLSISDPVIQNHLRDLREYGLIKKNEQGLYEMTEKGKSALLTLQYEHAAKFVSDVDQLLTSQERSKINPDARSLLIAYGFFLLIENQSSQGTTKKLLEIHDEAKERAQELRKSLKGYAPEYTSAFEYFGKGRPSLQLVTVMLGLTETFKSFPQKDVSDASKLMRQLYTELWKGRLKSLVGLKS